MILSFRFHGSNILLRQLRTTARLPPFTSSLRNSEASCPTTPPRLQLIITISSHDNGTVSSRMAARCLQQTSLRVCNLLWRQVDGNYRYAMKDQANSAYANLLKVTLGMLSGSPKSISAPATTPELTATLHRKTSFHDRVPVNTSQPYA